MNSEAEQLPVPRAERVNPDGDMWKIVHREGPWAFVYESALGLEENKGITEVHIAGKPISTGEIRALIEAAKLREQISETRERAHAKTNEINKLLGVTRRMKEACGMSPNVGDEWAIGNMAMDHATLTRTASPATDDATGWRKSSENWQQRAQEAEEQLDHLAQFIGHPGTTPAHVISETVSLIEKFQKVAKRLGLVVEAKPVSSLAEEMVALTGHVEEDIQVACGLALYLGFHPSEGVKVSVIIKKAADELEVRRELAEKAQKDADLQAERLNEIRASMDISKDATHSVACILARSWKSRALAAEAKLTGGPDDGKAPPNIAVLDDQADTATAMSWLRGYLNHDNRNRRSSDAEVIREAIDVMQSRAEEIGGYQLGLEQRKTVILPDEIRDGEDRRALRSLRQFVRIVRRMHGIPQSTEDTEALATIAEYLEKAEEWRHGGV